MTFHQSFFRLDARLTFPQVRLAVRDSVQQVTCRTSPTGECGKLLAVPNRGRASRLWHCYLFVSKFCKFWKYASMTKLFSKWYAASFRKFWIDSNLFLFSHRFYGIVLTHDEEKATPWRTICKRTLRRRSKVGSWKIWEVREVTWSRLVYLSLTNFIYFQRESIKVKRTPQRHELAEETTQRYLCYFCKKNLDWWGRMSLQNTQALFNIDMLCFV